MPNQNLRITTEDPALNRDPITGEPGAHPVGTGMGAAAGGATGAAIGSIAGPIGAVVGVVVGAVAGGLAGKGVAESIDPSAEDAYWREHHFEQSFAKDRAYEDYLPAYRSGYSGYREGKTFEEREADLRMEYEGGPQKAEADAVDAEPVVQEVRANATSGNLVHDMTPLRWPEGSEERRIAEERVRRGDPATTSLETRPGSMQGTNALRWEEAREAARAAYDRVHRNTASIRGEEFRAAD